MDKETLKRRRRYWIDPQVQGAIIRFGMTLNIGFIALIFLMDKYFFYRIEANGHKLGFPPEHVFFLFLRDQQKTKLMIFFAMVVLIMVVGGLMTFRFSHRLAGPIYRIKRELKRINNGEKIGKINLRDADFFKDLADEINKLTLKQKLRKADSDDKS